MNPQDPNQEHGLRELPPLRLWNLPPGPCGPPGLPPPGHPLALPPWLPPPGHPSLAHLLPPPPRQQWPLRKSFTLTHPDDSPEVAYEKPAPPLPFATDPIFQDEVRKMKKLYTEANVVFTRRAEDLRGELVEKNRVLAEKDLALEEKDKKIEKLEERVRELSEELERVKRGAGNGAGGAPRNRWDM